jgi:hypothetical protein
LDSFRPVWTSFNQFFETFLTLDDATA